MMPLDLGAKGSCHIGGNISTNAGGVRYLRYGSLHGSVLGLEVVLASGEVLDVLQQLRKDTTGYDLKQLFIGAEGTLGLVTAAAISCPPRPRSSHAAFLSCASFAGVLETYRGARADLGEILSAFEFLDRESLDLATGTFAGVKSPLPGAGEPFYVLLETSGSSEAHDREKLEGFLERAMAEGAIANGAVAQDGAQSKAFWRVREGVPEALNTRNATYKYDLSIPQAAMYGLVEDVRRRVEGEVGPSVSKQARTRHSFAHTLRSLATSARSLALTSSVWSAAASPGGGLHGGLRARWGRELAPRRGGRRLHGPPHLPDRALRLREDGRPGGQRQRGARPRADEGRLHRVHQGGSGGRAHAAVEGDAGPQRHS